MKACFIAGMAAILFVVGVASSPAVAPSEEKLIFNEENMPEEFNRIKRHLHGHHGNQPCLGCNGGGFPQQPYGQVQPVYGGHRGGHNGGYGNGGGGSGNAFASASAQASASASGRGGGGGYGRY